MELRLYTRQLKNNYFTEVETILYMKNNSALLIILLLLISFGVFAQPKKVTQLPNFDNHEINWGFYIGWNNSDYKIQYKLSEEYKNTRVNFDHKTGFNVGIIANMRISENFSLRFEPGLISNASTLYFIEDNDYPIDLWKENESNEIETTFLHIPLLLKFNAARLNNVRPYLIGGFSYDYNFSSNQENKDDNFAGEFRMQTHNFMYEVGLGFDFYFHYFKFSPSIRGQFAMTNEIKYDEEVNGPSPWTDPVDFMGTRSLFIKLSFE